MNIRELDELNIKAMLCDVLLEKEQIENHIQILKQELERREAEKRQRIQNNKKND